MAFVDSSSLSNITEALLKAQREPRIKRKPRPDVPTKPIVEQGEVKADKPETDLDPELLKKLENDLLETYKDFDINNNGIINEKELCRVIKMFRKDFSEEDAVDIVQELDGEDADGITYTCYEKAMRTVLQAKTVKDDFVDVFRFLDVNGDGYVSQLEMQIAFRHLGTMVTPDECLQIMSECDKNNDGLFTLEEFLEYCNENVEGYKVDLELEQDFDSSSEKDFPVNGAFG